MIASARACLSAPCAVAAQSARRLRLHPPASRKGRPARLFLLTCLLAAAGALALVSVPAALAAKKYQQVGAFARSFNFLIAESVAVNNHNGHIYVADSGTGQVLNFTSASDTSPTVWNGSNTPAGSFGGDGHVAVAVDNSTGDVYVADRSDAVIDKFDQNGNLITSFGDTMPSPNGQLAGAATPAHSFSPAGSNYSSFGIAVDQATHDLYAIDAHHQVIDVFDQNGTYLRQITATPTGLYRFGGDYTLGIAVNATTHNVYVSDWAGPNLVFQFDSSGNYVSTWNGGTLPNGSASETPDGNFSGECTGCYLISVATEDSSGKVLVGAMAHRDFDVFDAAGNFVPPQGTISSFGPSGIAVDQSNGDVYLSTYGSVEVFKLVIVPDITTNSASGLTASAATLSGHVDPATAEGGGPVTSCHFDVISNAAFMENIRNNGAADPWSGAMQVPCEPSSLPYSSPTDVSATVTVLSPGTEYHFRLVVSNAEGTNRVVGPDFATVGPYMFSVELGSTGSGDGQFKEPQDVAVDNSTGDIYVADTGNHRIVKLDSSGSFLATWGWGVRDGSAASQVCTSGCQAGISGSGAGQFESPLFIAVDNSTGPSAGDVYVADTADNRVQKFDSSGHLITSWGTGGAESYPAGIAGIAVDSAGALIVQPGTGTGIAVDSLGNVFSGPTGIAIDTSNNDRYYDYGSEILQFATAAECNLEATCSGFSGSDAFGFGNLNSATGLAINPSSKILYAANTGANDIAVFSPLPLPELTTAPVTNPGPTSATLTGHVDPHGAGNVTECHFEYGTDTSYSRGSVPCSPATSLSGPTDVSANLSGLAPFTTYHYRLVASGANDYGLRRFSRDRSFTTTPGLAPAVDATSSSGVTRTTATLSAQINPNSTPTIYRFQYGADTSYGSQTLPSESIGEDNVDHAVSTPVSGLRPGTTYHFRVVAVNFNGPTTGPDQTFSTTDLPAVAGTTASAISQTGATLGARVTPGFSPTTYHFEYGLSAAYGSNTPESAPIGSDDSVHPVSAVISGLAPFTTYHYRVVATNQIGTTAGSDQTFTTASSTPIVTPPPRPKCKKGFVKKQGKCVKKPHHKRKHHRRSHK